MGAEAGKGAGFGLGETDVRLSRRRKGFGLIWFGFCLGFCVGRPLWVCGVGLAATCHGCVLFLC